MPRLPRCDRADGEPAKDRLQVECPAYQELRRPVSCVWGAQKRNELGGEPHIPPSMHPFIDGPPNWEMRQSSALTAYNTTHRALGDAPGGIAPPLGSRR
jgi:hypothetical protein